eukprot:765521-Hanusia_phi.AAC.19
MTRRAGNHFYTVDFLDKASDLLTPYHIAKKKIPCIDESGQRVVPQANNGIKLEQFIFDCFPHSKSFACAEVPVSRHALCLNVSAPPGRPRGRVRAC